MSWLWRKLEKLRRNLCRHTENRQTPKEKVPGPSCSKVAATTEPICQFRKSHWKSVFVAQNQVVNSISLKVPTQVCRSLHTRSEFTRPSISLILKPFGLHETMHTGGKCLFAPVSKCLQAKKQILDLSPIKMRLACCCFVPPEPVDRDIPSNSLTPILQSTGEVSKGPAWAPGFSSWVYLFVLLLSRDVESGGLFDACKAKLLGHTL